MVALVAGQTERPFLENRIATVPQREGEAQPLLLVANAAQAVFIPAVGPRPGLIVIEMLPGFAVGAVVLTDRATGPFERYGPHGRQFS